MRAIASELTSFRRSSPLGLVESPHRFDSQPPCRQFPMLLLYTLMSVRSSLNSYILSMQKPKSVHFDRSFHSCSLQKILRSFFDQSLRTMSARQSATRSVTRTSTNFVKTSRTVCISKANLTPLISPLDCLPATNIARTAPESATFPTHCSLPSSSDRHPQKPPVALHPQHPPKLQSMLDAASSLLRRIDVHHRDTVRGNCSKRQ